MKAFFDTINNKIYDNLIRPLLQSVSPLKEAALGVSVGMFVGGAYFAYLGIS